MFSKTVPFSAVALILIALCWAGDVAAKDPTVVFGTEDLPPFNYLGADKTIKGPGKKIAEEICRRLDASCDFTLLPTMRLIHLMNKGEIHGIFSMGKNADREASMHFSKPYVRTEYGYFVNADNPIQITAPTDLKGYTILALVSSNMLNTVNRLFKKETPGIAEVEPQMSMNNVFNMLAAKRFGDTGVAFSNRDVGLHILRENNIAGVRYAGAQKTLLYYFAFPKQWVRASFVEDFNRELTTMHSDGTLSAILRAYKMEAPFTHEMR